MVCVFVISYESSTVLQASTMIKEHLSKFQVIDLLQPPMCTAHTLNKQTEIKLWKHSKYLYSIVVTSYSMLLTHAPGSPHDDEACALIS